VDTAAAVLTDHWNYGYEKLLAMLRSSSG
jgi:hypothetical protein